VAASTEQPADMVVDVVEQYVGYTVERRADLVANYLDAVSRVASRLKIGGTLHRTAKVMFAVHHDVIEHSPQIEPIVLPRRAGHDRPVANTHGS
jgi:hypothetical protein